MNPLHVLAILTNFQPAGWLVVLLALYFGGERRSARLRQSSLNVGSAGDQPPDYRALGVFVVLKLLSSLSYQVFRNQIWPLGLTPHVSGLVYFSTYWTLYLLSTVCVFFIIASILKNSLSPLPSLSAAAMVIFRWAAVLALVLASTAHIPVFGIRDVSLWLNEVMTSFALCVCSFEIVLLTILAMQLNRLGLCLRSRSVGLTMGLVMIGVMDVISAVTLNLPEHFEVWVAILNQVVVLAALMMWVYYIILPEPKRSPHSVPVASKLMRWNEIALKLDLNGRQSEQTPFIAGVQLLVDGILDKYKIGNNL